MTVPRYNQIHPGTPVSIILKADQPSGRQVQGTVTELLTRGDHPRGVKVRLSDGRVGRVQQVLSPGAAPHHPPAQHSYQAPPQPYTMSSSQHQHSAQPNAYSQQQQHTGRSTDPDGDLLPQGHERSEQMETMQSYEAGVPQSEDDANQAALQKEYPNLDSSLIAAIYNDYKSMGEAREMLQELSGGT